MSAPNVHDKILTDRGSKYAVAGGPAASKDAAEALVSFRRLDAYLGAAQTETREKEEKLKVFAKLVVFRTVARGTKAFVEAFKSQ